MRKNCNKCDATKPLDQFYDRKSSRDGKHNQCKSCINLANAKNAESKKTPEAKERQAKAARIKSLNTALFPKGLKVCSKCESEKPLDDFRNHGGSKDGKDWWCRDCASENEKTWRSQNKHRIKENSKRWHEENRDHHLKTQRKWWEKNKHEQAKKNLVRYHENRESRLLSSKRWRTENKNRYDENNRKWRSENRSRYLAYRRRVHKSKRKDPNYIVQLAARGIVKTCIKKIGSEKEDKTYELLGYTPEKLKIHLEKQFLKGMSWDNYGSEWHIDHIISISQHIKHGERDISVINCLSNLRPMWAKDNLKKGSKSTHLI